MDFGVFIPIGNNGWIISESSPQYMPSFALNKEIVTKAESYGFSFALSMVKLRGFGGHTEFWDHNLESFTLMAGLAAVTEKIRLYASVATLTLPPAMLARMASTIDDISGGRFGINIVTGWNKGEYEQMGLWPGMEEMASQVRRLVAAVDVPVIADADTGYGNAVNVIRTVQTYERAGVAGLHIEDQVAPKRCGHMDGKEVIPPADMVGRIRAAVDARSDPDLVVVARTDARAVEGLDGALERARAYRDAGADMLFVEALTGVDEITRVAAELADVPLVFNWAEGGRTPPLGHADLVELGYALVLMPITTLLAATRAMGDALARLRSDGTPREVVADLPTFDGFLDTIGLPEVRRLEATYSIEGDRR